MNHSKKSAKPEKKSAQTRKSKAENDDVKEKKAVVLELLSSESEPEKENASEAGKIDDSDDEEIRLLFENKVAARNVKKVGGKTLAKDGKRGGGRSSSGKEVEKSKGKGKMKMVMDKEEKEEEGESGDDRRWRKEEKKNKKVVVEEEGEGEEESEKEEGSACKFPMNRIHRIMKDPNCSTKIAQEAIFLANKALEKFIELYSREAYACTYLDHKNQVGYDHLASVVSKRKRFDFLSDIVPRKVKAEDALAEMSVAEN